jgi:hypothetical protein
LRLLQAREQYLSELFTAAREEVLTLSMDEARYIQLLEGTITQVSLIRYMLKIVLISPLILIEPIATNGTYGYDPL